MKFIRQMKSTYNHLEHLHHKHGIALHLSIFAFSLLLGIGLGISIFTINAIQTKLQLQVMKDYEYQVMDRIVKKIEAAPFSAVPIKDYPSATEPITQ